MQSKSISEVESEVGIPKETLRVWERRYAFPAPERDRHGQRSYPPEQVARLHLLKRLLDQGHRPGALMRAPPDELARLECAAQAAPVHVPRPQADLARALDLVRAHHVTPLRHHFTQHILDYGLRHFLLHLAAPMAGAVGQAWASGQLAIYEEHLFAETLQGVLRSAIFGAMRQAGGGAGAPRILLTTGPSERHGLGLLMAEAMLVLEGAHCVALGVQTPLRDIAAASTAHAADIVALSFSSACSVRTAAANLAELRQLLPATVALWAGGATALQAPHRPDGVERIGLEDIGPAVARWRAAHAV
jgi:methylmalonyl-CoA mutase cobalamin-binding subunit